jgi:arylsulfatase A-like enzyme
MMVRWTDNLAESAMLLLPMVFIGILLPMDFLVAVDGYRMYLRPPDLLAVYGWGVVFYLAIGMVSGGALHALLKCTDVFSGKWAGEVRQRVTTWIVGVIFLVALTKGAKSWLAAIGIPLVERMGVWQARWIPVLAIVLICTSWICRHRHLPTGAFRVIQLGTYCSIAALVLAPFVSIFADDKPASTTSRLPVKSAKPLPDIVLLTVDTFAASHSSAYGYARPTTPSLDRLSKTSTVFDHFYANSNFTTAGINSIIHGVRPWTHRALQLQSTVVPRVAGTSLPTSLAQAGYQNMAVVTNAVASPWHTGTEGDFEKVRYGQVHEFFSGIAVELFRFSPMSLNAAGLSLWSHLMALMDPLFVQAGIWSKTDQYDPELALSAARELVRKRELGKPMFLWIHLLQPHDPYAAQTPFLGLFDGGPAKRTRFDSSPPTLFLASADRAFPQEYVGRYDESLASVDAHIGAFLDWLRAQELFEPALILISADHGESFSHDYGGHTGPLLHDDLIRIPLIIKMPKQRFANRIKSAAEQVDIFPTILDLIGLERPNNIEGKSLLPVIGEDVSSPVFSMNFEQSSKYGQLETGSVAMIDWPWKYVEFRGRLHYENMPVLFDRLYNLQQDASEQENLLTKNPALARSMRSMVERELRVHQNVNR